MRQPLDDYLERLETQARAAGLDYYPVTFEEVPDQFMMEIAIYGLPVRMPHWSFGVRYIYQLVQHRMGHSRLFEVVFPGKPGRAYLARRNSIEENTLVIAHVLGHADFSKNNLLFRRSQEQVGYQIVEQAAFHAQQIESAIKEHGEARVERVLDAALALEQHVDVDKGLLREPYPRYLADESPRKNTEFEDRFAHLPGQETALPDLHEPERAPLPPAPEYDLLWFIAHHAPELEGWERDIFLAVRRESFYFYPVFACQIMNEGWASYWHARLLRDADFLPQQAYVDAIKTHSDVVRPYAGDEQIALSVNPYHLGFSMWERIVEEQGVEAARQIMIEEDDFGFVRNYLTEELADELGLFEYRQRADGEVTLESRDLAAIHDNILGPKFNFGAPRVCVTRVLTDGTLELRHDSDTDGRGLDLTRSEKVLDYVHRVWRRPVLLKTRDSIGNEKTLSSED